MEIWKTVAPMPQTDLGPAIADGIEVELLEWCGDFAYVRNLESMDPMWILAAHLEFLTEIEYLN